MIIAVDFDGVLCKDKFPEIGEPNYEVISLVRQLIDKKHEVILWTARVEKELDSAIEWCEDRGLHFTAINDNAPSNKEKYADVYQTKPRKIYADVYVDDHNLECRLEKSNGNEWITRYLKGVLNNELRLEG
jgi:hypothetical protein